MSTCKRRGHRNYNFVIQCAHIPLPQIPSHHSQDDFLLLCSWVYQMTRPGLYQTVAASYMLWVRTVNLVEKGRESLHNSFDMFVAEIWLDGMYAENREL